VLPDDNSLGLQQSINPDELDADVSMESTTSVLTDDTYGAEVPVYQAGDGAEPDNLQPDFMGTKRLMGEKIVHKAFGMWEINRTHKNDNDYTAQFWKYLDRLDEKGVCEGFRAFLVQGPRTYMYDIKYNAQGAVKLARMTFSRSCESWLMLHLPSTRVWPL